MYSSLRVAPPAASGSAEGASTRGSAAGGGAPPPPLPLPPAAAPLSARAAASATAIGTRDAGGADAACAGGMEASESAARSAARSARRMRATTCPPALRTRLRSAARDAVGTLRRARRPHLASLGAPLPGFRGGMARAGAASGALLADADVAALSSRLAGVAELALPASLLRQARRSALQRCATTALRIALAARGIATHECACLTRSRHRASRSAAQGAADDGTGRAAYVAELLRRDPALFLGARPTRCCRADAPPVLPVSQLLRAADAFCVAFCGVTERHGKLLRPAELPFFDALLGDYEVAFHARALAAAAGAAPARGAPTPRRERAPPATAVAKNRRLAHLEALERTGFFDEQAMRNRCACARRMSALARLLGALTPAASLSQGAAAVSPPRGALRRGRGCAAADGAARRSAGLARRRSCYAASRRRRRRGRAAARSAGARGAMPAGRGI